MHFYNDPVVDSTKKSKSRRTNKINSFRETDPLLEKRKIYSQKIKGWRKGFIYNFHSTTSQTACWSFAHGTRDFPTIHHALRFPVSALLHTSPPLPGRRKYLQMQHLEAERTSAATRCDVTRVLGLRSVTQSCAAPEICDHRRGLGRRNPSLLIGPWGKISVVSLFCEKKTREDMNSKHNIPSSER